jgi:outer membrane murein-binding lipoprotein Lpp
MSRIKLIVMAVVALGLLLGGWHCARVHDEAKQSKVAIKAQKQTIKRSQVRSHVEQETQKLPDVPVQRIGDASPDSAAGKLQEWSRD